METFLYVIAGSELGPSKIGYSDNPEKRVKQLQTGSSTVLSLRYSQSVSRKMAKTIERHIHRTNGHLRISGEWFNMSVEDAIIEVKVGLMRDI